MGRIHQLSEDIISKIAAGEVIERPVYAVKELVENAIDAHADKIIIHLEEAGIKKITVIDNGEGMNEEDLLQCFKPYSTSKITSVDQLQNIRTLGFRGEALSSIAAISQMEIHSRLANETEGRSLKINAGKREHTVPIGIPAGTVVTIANLFYTTPVRKKFLKSIRTEFSYIVSLVTKYALAYPLIRFVLTHNHKQIFDVTKTMNTIHRVKLLLGTNIYDSLLPLSHQTSYIKIDGFITKPQITSRNAQKQYLFINDRAVTDKTISQAAKDAYGTLLEPQASPIYILFITISPDIVDVNIHPRKEEVRFSNTQLIYESIYTAIKASLAQHNLIFQNKNWKSEIISPRFGYTDSFAAEVLKEASLPWDSRNITTLIPTADIQQMHDLYLVTQTKHGILLIDQHAAHERILYEEFLHEFKKQNHPQLYSLPQSVPFELSFAESEVLQENIPLFEQLGYEIEQMKDNTFFLSAVPVLLKDRDNLKVITEILADILQDKKTKDIDRTSKKMISYLACRSAIKAGDRLTKKQGKTIIEKLYQTPNNATCPHGRPTTVEIDLKQINKLFKR